LRLITAVIAKSKARVNKRASQEHSHGFSNSRQTYVPKAPNSGSSASLMKLACLLERINGPLFVHRKMIVLW